MLNDLDFWTAIVSDVPPSAVERLCLLVDFSNPPDFVEFVREQIEAHLQQDLSCVWPILVETGIIGRAVIAVHFVQLPESIEPASLALSHDPNFDSRLLRQLMANRIWPEEVPFQESLRTLEIVEALGVADRQVMTLLKFAQFPHPFVQSKAAKLLGRTCDSMKVINELFGNPDKRVRANLIEGIGARTDITEYKPLLKAAASDQDVRLSTLALAILAGRGDQRSTALLKLRLRSKVTEFAGIAKYLSGKVEGHNS